MSFKTLIQKLAIGSPLLGFLKTELSLFRRWMRSKCRPRLLVAPQGFRVQYVYVANECRYFCIHTQKIDDRFPAFGFSKNRVVVVSTVDAL